MGIDDLIRMSRAEDLDVDEMDMEYGFCQCKNRKTDETVWVAELDDGGWVLFRSFEPGTPAFPLKDLRCKTISEVYGLFR